MIKADKHADGQNDSIVRYQGSDLNIIINLQTSCDIVEDTLL